MPPYFEPRRPRASTNPPLSTAQRRLHAEPGLGIATGYDAYARLVAVDVRQQLQGAGRPAGTPSAISTGACRCGTCTMAEVVDTAEAGLGSLSRQQEALRWLSPATPAHQSILATGRRAAAVMQARAGVAQPISPACESQRVVDELVGRRAARAMARTSLIVEALDIAAPRRLAAPDAAGRRRGPRDAAPDEAHPGDIGLSKPVRVRMPGADPVGAGGRAIAHPTPRVRPERVARIESEAWPMGTVMLVTGDNAVFTHGPRLPGYGSNSCLHRGQLLLGPMAESVVCKAFSLLPWQRVSSRGAVREMPGASRRAIDREISWPQRLGSPFAPTHVLVDDSHVTLVKSVARADLTHYIRQPPPQDPLLPTHAFRAAMAAQMMMQVLAQLSVVHDEWRVSHNDLKPDNIFVDAFHNFWIDDFGVTSDFDHIDHGATTSFMPPEYLLSEPRQTHADDMWSLGKLLLLTLLGPGADPVPMHEDPPMRRRQVQDLRQSWRDVHGLLSAYNTQERRVLRGESAPPTGAGIDEAAAAQRFADLLEALPSATARQGAPAAGALGDVRTIFAGLTPLCARERVIWLGHILWLLEPEPRLRPRAAQLFKRAQRTFGSYHERYREHLQRFYDSSEGRMMHTSGSEKRWLAPSVWAREWRRVPLQPLGPLPDAVRTPQASPATWPPQRR